MLRLLTDEDFDGWLTSALLARLPGLDLLRVQDVGLMHTPDPDVLAWAGAAGRIVLTHARNTMTGFATTRVKAGQPMPGLFVVDRKASSGRTLNDLEVLAAASEMDEWRDQIIFVPLQRAGHPGFQQTSNGSKRQTGQPEFRHEFRLSRTSLS
jgi:hypothetical protein